MKLPGVVRRSGMTVFLVVALLSSSMLVLGTAGPASATTPPDPVVSQPSPFLGCTGVLGVNGPRFGIPIAGTVMSDVKVHLVFWLPTGYSFAPGVANGDAQHIALVERLFNDLSGSETYNILTQYGDGFPQYPDLGADPARGYHPSGVHAVRWSCRDESRDARPPRGRRCLCLLPAEGDWLSRWVEQAKSTT